METVLVIGATGNIGVSAVTAALRSKRKVLAIVRNEASAEKLLKHIGSSEEITFVEADVLSDSGIRGVVDQVRVGKLPSFQHVYSCGSLHIILPSQSSPLKFQLSWRRVCDKFSQGHHHRKTSLQHEGIH